MADPGALRWSKKLADEPALVWGLWQADVKGLLPTGAESRIKAAILQLDGRFRREYANDPNDNRLDHVFCLFDAIAEELKLRADFGDLLAKQIPDAVNELWGLLWWWIPRCGGSPMGFELLRARIHEWQGRTMLEEPKRAKAAGSKPKARAIKKGRPAAIAVDGDRLRHLRGERTQAVFARACRVSVDTIQRAEAGHVDERYLRKIVSKLKSEGASKADLDALKKNRPQ